MTWYGYILIGLVVGIIIGSILYAWIDKTFPEQPTTEQHIGKQKIKGEGIRAIFQNVFNNIKKRSKK